MFKTIIRFLSLLVFIFFSQLTVAQLSKKHFIPPLTSGDNFGEQYIYISTPKNFNVSYKITAIGKPDLDAYSGVVSNNNPVEQPILDSFGNVTISSETQLHTNRTNLTANKITDKGFIIEASDIIYVSIRVGSSFANAQGPVHAAALVSKGAAALGTDFRLGAMVNEGSIPNAHTAFASFMATNDNTTVNISNLPVGILLPSGIEIPTSIVLDEGESYIIALGDNEDLRILVGALISSDKPIVVNVGSATGSFGFNPSTGGTTQDYGIDQIVGADKIGTDYIVVKGNGNDSVENVLVVAHEDNTSVSVNGNLVTQTPLTAGEYLIIEGNSYSANGNMFIQTSKPVFVYQGIGGTNSNANQGMFFVPPLSCENKGDVNNIAFINKVGGVNFDQNLTGVTIVTNTGSTVTINGNPIFSFSTQGPFNVPGKAEYVTYRVTGLSGNVSVQSDNELYCAYFNASGAATTGAFYSGFPSAPEINFETTVASLGSCIPNLTLEAANTEIFDSFEWQYFNENTGLWETRSTNSSYKPLDLEPGRYKLIGIVNCTGTTFESLEIPISFCPDDFDGDLIIDNLDIDLDNDGILNSTESLGNATLNLTDKDNPKIVFQDATTNSTIISGVYTSNEATNAFIGQNTGDFVSVVNPAPSSNGIYELNFTQKINFLFKQSVTGNHVKILLS